jgi:chromosome segregation ATPase
MLLANNDDLEQKITEGSETIPVLQEEVAAMRFEVGKLSAENARLQKELEATKEILRGTELSFKYVSARLDIVEVESKRLEKELADTKLTLNNTKSSLENAEEAELKAAKYVDHVNLSHARLRLDYSTLHEAFDTMQSCVLARNLHDLTAENIRLEAELTVANNALDQNRPILSNR